MKDRCTIGTSRECAMPESFPVVLYAQTDYYFIHRDCGLACAAMVLSVLVRPAPSLQALSELCRTTSVWTIDLAHVLRYYGIQVIVTTTCLGANPSYSSASFYAPHLEHDIARVNELFARADGAGINVIKASISSAQLKRLLRTCKYLAIALVDKTKTGHALQIGSPSGVVRLDSGMVDDTYTGHFILLHGYDSLADEYFFKDPAAPVGSNGRISPALLDEARQSYGTDEDLIFIFLPNP